MTDIGANPIILINYIGDNMVIHKICNSCGKIGHKRDMVVCLTYSHVDDAIVYYHEECYKEKRDVIKRCKCGKGWVIKISEDILPNFIDSRGCHNHGEFICNLHYACDGCPYNPELW